LIGLRNRRGNCAAGLAARSINLRCRPHLEPARLAQDREIGLAPGILAALTAREFRLAARAFLRGGCADSKLSLQFDAALINRRR
jgi:hypothetical protein